MDTSPSQTVVPQDSIDIALDENAPVEELDTKIQSFRKLASSYRGQVQKLSRLRNTKSRSSKLSVEALRYVFQLLARDPVRLHDDWDWVIVSQVCQIWRAVALDTRDVWSNIVCNRCHSSRRAKMHLRLSGIANLSVVFKQTDSNVSVFKYLVSFKLILAHMKRITELRIDVLEDVWNKFSDLPEFQNPASRLDFLDIRVHSEERPDRLRVPINFLSASTLKKAFFEKIKFPELSTMPSLDTLAELSLENIRFHSSEFLDTLRLCPKLEILDLTASGTPGDPTPPSFDQIQLPYLRYLHLDMPLSEVCHHFQYLKIPETCDLNIDGFSFVDFMETVQSYNLDFLLNRPLRSKSLHIAVCDTEVLLEMEGFPEQNTVAPNGIKTKFSHVFYTTDVNRTTSVETICSTAEWILQNSNLTGLEMVRLRLGPEDGIITQNSWFNILKHLSSISYLSIAFLGEDPKSEEEFARALRLHVMPNAPGDGFPLSILCPKLAHLSLGLAHFSPDFRLELEHALQFRIIHNAGLDLLYIHEAFGIKDDHMLIRDLAKYVRHIHWDELDDTSDRSSVLDGDNNTPDSDDLESGSESELEDYITEVSDYDYDQGSAV